MCVCVYQEKYIFSLCQEIACNKSQLHTHSVMEISRIPRLFLWLSSPPHRIQYYSQKWSFEGATKQPSIIESGTSQNQRALGCNGADRHQTEHAASVETGKRTQFFHWSFKLSNISQILATPEGIFMSCWGWRIENISEVAALSDSNVNPVWHIYIMTKCVFIWSRRYLARIKCTIQ